jgi:hypothetical protein
VAKNEPIPFGGKHFSAVKRVKNKIREDAEAIYTEFRNALKMATAAGQYEAAIKGYTWLHSHIPADEDGTRVVDQDIDKPKQVDSGSKGPQIQIGIAMGVTPPTAVAPKALSAEVIELDPEVE